MPKRSSAFLTALLLKPSCQTKETVVQTGAKIQLGGLKEGLLIVVYQVSMEEAVAIPPTEPKTTQAMMLMISLMVKDGLFITFIYSKISEHKCKITRIVYKLAYLNVKSPFRIQTNGDTERAFDRK